MTSFRSQILHRTLKRVVGIVGMDLPIKEQRMRLNELARRGIRIPRNIDVCPERAGDVNSEWVEPHKGYTPRVILYLHGGGYCICSPDTHRGLAAGLALSADCRVFLPGYRLAPENPFPAALDDAISTYRWLLSRGIPPRLIAIGGDSAGGGLAISVAMNLRNSGIPLPACLFLLSPWTDLTFSGDSIQSRRPFDPIFSKGGDFPYVPAYVGSASPADPLISPLFGDLHGLPPTMIHVGMDEILLDDSTRLEKKLADSGVPVQLKIWDGLWHVFQAFAPWLPEAQFSIDQLAAFVVQCIPAGPL